MTNLRKLSQQLASTSRNSKFWYHHSIKPWTRESTSRDCPTITKQASCSDKTINLYTTSASVNDCTRIQTEDPSRLLSSEPSSYVNSRPLFSPIKCPSYEGLSRDSIAIAQVKEISWSECLKQTSYYFHNGLRHVYPYDYTFHTNVKEKWVGEPVGDFFQRTFYAVVDGNWVERDVTNGNLTINGSPASVSQRLKVSDKIQHKVHRHELPVLDRKVEILHIDSHVLVINKPPSIPIHPTGRYHHNTLLYILARELKMTDLYLVHRLDMGTSGVFLLARNKKTAKFFSRQNANRLIAKTYVARVVGKFPKGVVECDQPLGSLDEKTRINRVRSDGKPSKSSFESIAYNSKTNTSVVLCKPHTGRTHQLRVHLQYLGFPIDNDPLYNNPMFGPNRGKGGVLAFPPATIIKLWESNRSRWSPSGSFEINTGEIVYEPWSEIVKGPLVDPGKGCVDPNCEICPLHLIVNPADLGFHLHALEYKGPDWSFSSPWPEWAHPDWEND